MRKILIIRLSSFGDIVQCLSVTSRIKRDFPQSEISFLTKKQFAELATLNKEVSNVIAFDRQKGLIGWIKLCLELRKEDFDVVYDAHSNIRTLILRILLIGSGQFKFFKRSKSRIKRILLFTLRMNLFPKPFRGMVSFQDPIEALLNSPRSSIKQDWDFSRVDKDKIERLVPKTKRKVVCCPSAAWQMKRWPLDHWKSLFFEMKDYDIVVLGGPEDHFCEELKEVDPSRIINLAGKLSLIESSYIVSQADCFLSADTGLIHVAEILGRPGISLIGPTAFGFPTHENIKTLEVPMSCRPCTKDGRGKCSQDVYQKCMVEITPDKVAKEIREILD